MATGAITVGVRALRTVPRITLIAVTGTVVTSCAMTIATRAIATVTGRARFCLSEHLRYELNHFL